MAAGPQLPPPNPSWRGGFAKSGIAIVLALVTWCGTQHHRRLVSSSAGSADATANSQLSVENTIKTKENLLKAIPGMKESNDLLINWSIVLLGGTFSIALLSKGAKIRDQNWCLVSIPSIWVLLWISLTSGYEFKRTLTFQISQDCYSLPKLNLWLILQLDFF